MKFAAVILIPFIMAGRILLIKNFIIPFNYGSRISFDLPDGTTRMLNSGSSLEYTFPFKNNRYVKLTGEAWFEVKHDEVHPFVVNLLDSDVKVLGTSFNVSAYPEEDYIEIVLFKGSVEFINKEKNEKTLMLPSEKLVLHDDNLHKTLIDTTKYNAWIEGKLIFRSVSMGEVISRIGRWYNVDIELADEQLKSYSFRGTFINDKIEDILAFLAMTSPIKYEIIPGKMQSDSTFENEELLFL